MSDNPDVDIDVTRAMTAKGHPNQPCSQQEIEQWVSRVDDINSAIHDFLHADPEELERRRRARRAEIQEKERLRKKQLTAERYDTAFYRRYEDDKFIDALLADVDKKEDETAAAVAERRRKQEEREEVKNKMTEFERIALEEAHKGKARGNALVGQGNWAEANEVYSNVIGMDPDDDALLLAVRNNRALTALKKQPADFSQAAEDASFVIAQQPKNIKARMRRAAALSGLHRPKAAIADLRVVLRCDGSVAEAKKMMLGAQRELEETEAADKVGGEDEAGAKKFVEALDGLGKCCAKLDKLLFVPAAAAEDASADSSSSSPRALNTKTPDSELAAAGREALEHIVTVSNALGLDDGFASLLRLRGGFKLLFDFSDILYRAVVVLGGDGNSVSQVLELSLALSSALRVLASALSVERTAAAFSGATPEVCQQLRELVVEMVVTCDKRKESASDKNAGGKYVAILGAALSALAHLTTNAVGYNWGEQQQQKQRREDEILFATAKTFEASSPLLPDGLLLGASVMLAGDRIADQLLGRARNLGKVLFAALDLCRAQRDFASPRSRAVATMLLRVSARRELAAELGANAQKLVQLMAVLAAEDKAGGVRCGMLMEGVLSALHNGVVLCSIDRTKLAPLIVAAATESKKQQPLQWVEKFLAATISSEEQRLNSVNNSSSVVSKFLALLSKAVSPASEGPEAAAAQQQIVAALSGFWLTHLPPLCRVALDFLKRERDAKALKLADADATSVDIVAKAAAQGVAALPQANLLENITLVIASIIMAAPQQQQQQQNSDNDEEVLLAPLALDLIKDATALCLPRVAGNAALWLTQRLAANKAAVDALRKSAGDAGKAFAVLFGAIKELSSQLYDAERSGDEAASKMQQAMLKSARKNVAVVVAKLSGEGDFMQAFRDQGGAQLFSNLQLA